MVVVGHVEPREEAAVSPHRQLAVSGLDARTRPSFAKRARWVLAFASLAVIVIGGAFLFRDGRTGASIPTSPLVPDNRARAAAARRAYEAIPLTSQSTPLEMFYSLMGHARDFSFDRGGVDTSCQQILLEYATWHPVFQGSAIAAIIHEHSALLGDLEHDRAPGLEGHFCQWLFILSRIHTNAEHLAIALPPDGTPSSAAEFVRAAQRLCHSASDWSRAVPVLARWGEREWTSRFGEKYTLDSLAESHLRQEGTSTACFGTHW